MTEGSTKSGRDLVVERTTNGLWGSHGPQNGTCDTHPGDRGDSLGDHDGGRWDLKPPSRSHLKNRDMTLETIQGLYQMVLRSTLISREDHGTHRSTLFVSGVMTLLSYPCLGERSLYDFLRSGVKERMEYIEVFMSLNYLLIHYFWRSLS